LGSVANRGSKKGLTGKKKKWEKSEKKKRKRLSALLRTKISQTQGNKREETYVKWEENQRQQCKATLGKRGGVQTGKKGGQ